MAYTNYPDGITAFGVPTMGVNGVPATSARIWYVSSVIGSAGYPGTMTQPYATITQAQSAASSGDIVVLMSGHAETVSGAAGIDLSKAGVTYVGIGSGSARPTFTFSATASTITMTAASVSLTNIIGVPSIDSVVSPFVVSAANVTLGLEWRDASATVEAVRAVLTTAAADNFTLNLTYLGYTAGNAVVNAARLVGGRNANINVDFYGVASTAVVEFHTTAVVNAEVRGTFYVSGTTDLSKDVVDTATGSTWFAVGFDAAAGQSFSGGSAAAIAPDDGSTGAVVATVDGTANAYARDVVGNKTDAAVTTVGTTKSILGYAKGILTNLLVPTADVATNTNATDVVGNKTDAAVTAVGTTKSILAYAKGLITMATVQSADSTNNAFAGDVVGNKTDAAVYAPGTTKSLAAYAKGSIDVQEKVARAGTAVMVNGNTLFTIAGGPIEIMSLVSVCATANDATASTLQYSVTPTVGAAQTISGASASLANAAAGASVTLAGTALATAALYNANGPNLIANPGTIYAPAGTITAVIGIGSTTGTWTHYLRYKPLATGVTVT